MAINKCENNRQRKKYLNEAEELLRKEFEHDLKNMTRTQGKFLIKLIHRETGQTAFDLLKEYRGGFKTFWWNFAGKFYQLDLKVQNK